MIFHFKFMLIKPYHHNTEVILFITSLTHSSQNIFENTGNTLYTPSFAKQRWGISAPLKTQGSEAESHSTNQSSSLDPSHQSPFLSIILAAGFASDAEKLLCCSETHPFLPPHAMVTTASPSKLENVLLGTEPGRPSTGPES